MCEGGGHVIRFQNAVAAQHRIRFPVPYLERDVGRDARGNHVGRGNGAQSVEHKFFGQVRFAANQLVAKNLIEIVEVGNGRGKATVYRIRVEDPRFPWPKKQDKPGRLDFPVSEINPEAQTSHFQEAKPGSTEAETRKSQPENPEVKTEKPGSLNCHTDSNSLIQRSNARSGEGSLRSLLHPMFDDLIRKMRSELQLGLNVGEITESIHFLAYRHRFKEQCKAIGIEWRAIEREWNEVVRGLLPPLPFRRQKEMLDWVMQEKERPGGFDNPDVMFTEDYARTFVPKSRELGVPYPADLERFLLSVRHVFSRGKHPR